MSRQRRHDVLPWGLRRPPDPAEFLRVVRARLVELGVPDAAILSATVAPGSIIVVIVTDSPSALVGVLDAIEKGVTFTYNGVTYVATEGAPPGVLHCMAAVCTP